MKNRRGQQETKFLQRDIGHSVVKIGLECDNETCEYDAVIDTGSPVSLLKINQVDLKYVKSTDLSRQLYRINSSKLYDPHSPKKA